MAKVRIVTDSTADIPSSVLEKLNISSVPLKVLFGEELFLDGITMKAPDFYKRLVADSVLPTTSQPSPAEFSEVYQEILEQDPDAIILSFHISAALSGTYQSATIASGMIEAQADITVIDTKSTCSGLGIPVIRAAEMAAAGATKEEIIEEVSRLGQEIELYFLVDTLEYLHKGGRIGKASALIGSLLNIKPILSLDKSEGVVHSLEKIRGSKKAVQRIVQLMVDSFGKHPIHMTISYTNNYDRALEFNEMLQASLNVQSVDYTTVGSVIGTHTGPGTLAVFAHKV